MNGSDVSSGSGALPPELLIALQSVSMAFADSETQQAVVNAALEAVHKHLRGAAARVLLGGSMPFLETAGDQGPRSALLTWWDRNQPQGQSAAEEAQGTVSLFDVDRPGLPGSRWTPPAPTRSVVVPLVFNRQPYGMLVFDIHERRDLTAAEQQFLALLADRCAAALSGAARSMPHGEQVQTDAALGAYIRYTDSAAGETDVLNSARQASDLLAQVFPGCICGYSTLDDGLWDLCVQSGAPPDRRVPADTSLLTEAVQSKRPVFVNGQGAGEVTGTSSGPVARAAYPLLQDDGVCAVLDIRLSTPGPWTGADRMVFTAVGRSLDRVLARSAAVREVHAGNAELEARTRALEYFAELARRQDADVLTLVRQAQTYVHELIGEGYAVYYELEDQHWHLKSQVGSPQSPAIQAMLETALPYETVRNFRIPWESGIAFYLDVYTPDIDGMLPGTETIASTAALPLFVGAVQQGMFGYGLTLQRKWTRADRVALETAVSSLGFALERAAQARAAEDERTALDAFVHFTEAVGAQSDVLALVGEAIEILRSRFPDASVVYYEQEATRWQARVWSGANPEEVDAQRQAGRSREVPMFAQALAVQQVVFTDVWDAGRERRTHSEPARAVANYPLFVNGECHWMISIGRRDVQRWQERDKAVVRAVGRGLNLALERSTELRQLEEERAALSAFTRFTESVGDATDVLTLIQQALTLLHEILDVDAAYFEREGERFKIRAWTDGFPAPLLLRSQHGFTSQHPSYRQVETHRDTVFFEPWDAQQEGVPESDRYRVVAFQPLMREHRIESMLLMSSEKNRQWTARAQGIFRAVGRSLSLALKRAEQAEELRTKTEELEAQTRALEGIAQLSHDLAMELDQHAVIRRAQAMILSLLPTGYTAFYEVHGSRWQAVSQLGDLGSASQQEAIDAGFPVGQTPALDLPFASAVPLFLDLDHPVQTAPLHAVSPIQTFSSLPVLVSGAVIGILSISLSGARPWSRTDRALLITTVRSLGLVMEGAVHVTQLAKERRTLALTNEELEAFAYSASHDLRTPVRHIMSFTELASQALTTTPNEKVSRYLNVVQQATGRMTALIDGILLVSRAARQPTIRSLVDVESLVLQVRNEQRAAFPDQMVHWHIGPLPTVPGDRTLLQQVFTQLLGNALKFSSLQPVSNIEVWADERDTEWMFFVRDNGVGFDLKYRQKLFGLFQRLHSEKQFAGVGVGLAIVRRIVVRLGGQVFAEGAVDAGATFMFTLPKDPETAARP